MSSAPKQGSVTKVIMWWQVQLTQTWQFDISSAPKQQCLKLDNVAARLKVNHQCTQNPMILVTTTSEKLQPASQPVTGYF